MRWAGPLSVALTRGIPALLARDLTVTGATVMRVELEVSNVVTRDDDADPTSLFVVSDRYAFHLDTRG